MSSIGNCHVNSSLLDVKRSGPFSKLVGWGRWAAITAMLYGRNNRFFFLFRLQNIFIVPAMQRGCRAKPLYPLYLEFLFEVPAVSQSAGRKCHDEPSTSISIPRCISSLRLEYPS